MSNKRTTSQKLFIAVLITALFMGALPTQPVFAAVTFTVNSLLDQPDDLTIPGTCHTAANTCTLRAAIMQANRTSGVGATIIVPAGVYTLTIPAVGADGEENGDLNLTSPISGSPAITINGAGAGSTIIDANQLDRVFNVHGNRTATLTNMTIQNGYVSASGGGGILNNGSLTVTSSALSNNSVGGYGGGIYNNAGSLIVKDSAFSGNSAGYGGGIFNSAGKYMDLSNTVLSENVALDNGGGIINAGTLIVANSILSGNTAQFGNGGGIHNVGALTVTNSIISGNSSLFYIGGGIYNAITLIVTNSSISGNSADIGGGIFNGGTLTVTNATISQNKADSDGGGIGNYGTANVYNTSIVFNGADDDEDLTGRGAGVFNSPTYTFNLRNSLVAGNSLSHAPVYEDCNGILNSYGKNLFWDVSACTVNTGGGSWTYLNSLSSIGPLKNNGGSTWTHALLTGSNAIDGGDPVGGCIDSNSVLLNIDQRGAARVSGARCDIGAYEYVAPVTLHSTGPNDGWILESTETSNAGGTLNASATTFNLGDGAADKQYRAILSFNTSSLPDNAVITKVLLRIKKQGLTGTDPFTLLGGLKVDMKRPHFGPSAGLVIGDFQASAGRIAAATFNATPVNNWYSALMSVAGRNYVNKKGLTQFRLHFALDDNNDNSADSMRFFSGNHATTSVRPTLIIEYYVP